MDKKNILRELLDNYQNWVRHNPNVVTDAETVLTWSSYFVAGKINKSPVVSELVYSLSKLLSLYNDKLIRDAYGTEIQTFGTQEKIKMCLTIIHYCEVFVELVARRKCGNSGKWTLATLLQLIKCSGNLILLYKYKVMPIQHPPVPMLQRKKCIESKNLDENYNDCFKLKRSGRVIRRVHGAPPLAFRDWQPVKSKDDSQNLNVNIRRILYAETLHVIKPLVHLLSMGLFGTKAWKQWFLSLALDMASLKLYDNHVKDLNYEQRLEISRRKLTLLLYLLRSPVYNRYSKNIIERFLTSTAKAMPITDIVCQPVLQYLNHWQDIYFYMWTS